MSETVFTYVCKNNHTHTSNMSMGSTSICFVCMGAATLLAPLKPKRAKKPAQPDRLANELPGD
jgi:hypothetical protein